MNQNCVLAVTPGDPAGVGLDLTLMLAQKRVQHRIVAVADRKLLEERAKQLDIDVAFVEYKSSQKNLSEIECMHVDCNVSVKPGQADPEYAAYVLNTLDVAIDGCLSGEFDAMVTGPINKETIILSGVEFTGHTEYLAQRTNSSCPVMLLSDDKLRVALATIHIPLSQVAKHITRQRILDVARVLNHDLTTRFGIKHPRIGVCGLNPHAGEGGQLGTEEIDEIVPAIKQLQSENIGVAGPFPADTIFIKNRVSQYDAVLAMYHDQGLPVIKHAAFGEVVNITLGLPIVRTSVDHGTAYDLAGSGKADASSLLSAVSMAAKLCSSSGE